MSAAEKLPVLLTVAEFLARRGDGTGRIPELVDGVIRMQDSASDAHGTIQGRLVYLLTAHHDGSYPKLPSVTEILVVDLTKVEAHLLRRDAVGVWPENPTALGAGAELQLESVAYTLSLSEAYRGTHLA